MEKKGLRIQNWPLSKYYLLKVNNKDIVTTSRDLLPVSLFSTFNKYVPKGSSLFIINFEYILNWLS